MLPPHLSPDRMEPISGMAPSPGLTEHRIQLIDFRWWPLLLVGQAGQANPVDGLYRGFNVSIKPSSQKLAN